MCTTCETLICAIFDRLVVQYFLEFPPTDDESRRPKYMPMDVRDAPNAATTVEDFTKMVEASTGIGYDPNEFMHELGRQTELPEQVANWARGKIPNGLARRMILTRAEMMIRERGAAPELTLLRAA